MSRLADKIRKELGERLNALRYEKRFNRDQMAAWMGTTHSGYYKNEKGQNLPGIASLSRLANEHDISMDWLLFGKGPRLFKEKSKVEHLANELEKTKHEKENAVPGFRESLKPGLNDMLNTIDEEPGLYHSIMVFYHEYMDKQEKEKKS